MRAGERLKELRNRLGITTREVEEYSRRIAESEGNEEFHVSNAWITQIENSESTPSVYKLYSLSVIYRLKFTDLLLLYGVDLEKLSKYHALTPLPQTHSTSLQVYDEDQAITFPIRFDPGFRLEKTNLVSRMVETRGEVPIALIRHLDVRHSLYGYIGLEDHTLYPFLRPGSFVQIDDRQQRIQKFRWQTEFDRPIYFIELREGYACGWCEFQDNKIILVPHPLSGCGIRQFAYQSEAEIVGRVTGVAMRIVNSQGSASPSTPILPTQS